MRHQIDARRSSFHFSLPLALWTIWRDPVQTKTRKACPRRPSFEQNEALYASPSSPFRHVRTSGDPNVAAGQAAIVAGKQIFRFDTFGDEAFWGGTLRLHEAIEGSAQVPEVALSEPEPACSS